MQPSRLPYLNQARQKSFALPLPRRLQTGPLCAGTGTANAGVGWYGQP